MLPVNTLLNLAVNAVYSNYVKLDDTKLSQIPKDCLEQVVETCNKIRNKIGEELKRIQADLKRMDINVLMIETRHRFPLERERALKELHCRMPFSEADLEIELGYFTKEDEYLSRIVNRLEPFLSNSK